MSSSNCTVAGEDTTGTSGTSGNEGGGVFRTGIQVIQAGDFFQQAGVLHPVVIGSIALILTFAYIRRSSNRAVAPFSIWDKLLEVALGSTLAGIINGNSLVRGLLGLTVLFAFQRVTSSLSVRFPRYCGWILDKPSLIVVFRGEQLNGVMHKHRISQHDLNAALRLGGIWNVAEVHLMCIETNGAFTIYRETDYPQDFDPTLLLAVPGYRELCDADPGEESEAVKRARAERQVVGFKSLRRASMRKPGARTERGTGGGDGDSNGKRCKTNGKTGFNRDEEKQSSGRGGFDGDEEDDIEGRQGRDDERECSGRDTGDRRSMHSKSSIANRAAKGQEHHDKEDHSEN